MHEDARIELDVALERSVLLAHLAEVVRQVRELFEVELRVVLRALESRDERFGRRLRGALRERRKRAVDDVEAGLDSFDVRHLRHAAGAMAVELDGDLHDFLDVLHDLVSVVRMKEAGHVLQADGVGAHVHELLRLLGVHVGRVDGANCVADGALSVAAGLLHGLDGRFEVSQVVDGVEDAEDVHPVLDGELAELLDNIVRVVAVADDVLAAE